MTTKKRSLPRITARQFVADRNDDVRSALNLLGRIVLPHLDVASCYVTDLVHDALHLAEMSGGEELYIHVTDVGTYMFADLEQMAHTTRHISPPRAVFKLTCTVSRYGSRHWNHEQLR